MKHHETLRAVGREMHTQNNAATAHPVFVVQDEERIYGIASDYADEANVEWYDGCESSYAPDDPEVAEIEAAWQSDHTEPGDWSRVYYVTRWRFVQLFFSRKGAEQYISDNAHNLKKPRVYVESAHRNRELIAVREALMAAATPDQPKPAPSDPGRYDLSEGAPFYQPEPQS